MSRLLDLVAWVAIGVFVAAFSVVFLAGLFDVFGLVGIAFFGAAVLFIWAVDRVL